MKKTTIGGQGVMDGVMMRAKTDAALAVRKPSGEIVTKKWSVKQRTNTFLKLPVIRGVVSFIDMMISGVAVLSDAMKLAGYDEEEYSPSKFETFVADKTGKNADDVMMVFAVVLAIVLAVGIFFLLPTFITSLFQDKIGSVLVKNLIDGVLRIFIFLLYMVAITFVKDIKRVFMYHGAEHKIIACYEHEEPLTVENARKYGRLHPRCGTSYMFLVMIITMLINSLFGWSENIFLRIGIRLLMIPITAGVSYEVLMFLGKHDFLLARMLRWPGMQLQWLTTQEPDDDMLEVAIVAFEMALGEKTEEEIEARRLSFDRQPEPDLAEAKPLDEQA